MAAVLGSPVPYIFVAETESEEANQRKTEYRPHRWPGSCG
jgi:hypothetical protein